MGWQFNLHSCAPSLFPPEEETTTTSCGKLHHRRLTLDFPHHVLDEPVSLIQWTARPANQGVRDGGVTWTHMSVERMLPSTRCRRDGGKCQAMEERMFPGIQKGHEEGKVNSISRPSPHPPPHPVTGVERQTHIMHIRNRVSSGSDS